MIFLQRIELGFWQTYFKAIKMPWVLSRKQWMTYDGTLRWCQRDLGQKNGGLYYIKKKTLRDHLNYKTLKNQVHKNRLDVISKINAIVYILSKKSGQQQANIVAKILN